jgi:hypothetical protein
VTVTAIDGGPCAFGGLVVTSGDGGSAVVCNGAPGAAGDSGQSVTSTALPVGDSHCPFGGNAITSASGTTYACNGDPGSSAGARWFWVDATGKIIGVEHDNYYVDDAGYYWTIDVNSAQLGGQEAIPFFFADAGCSGPPWIFAFQPRLVMHAPSTNQGVLPGVDAGFYVRPDTGASTPLTVISLTTGLTCNSGGATLPSLPLSSCAVLKPPLLNATPPLHIESR